MLEIQANIFMFLAVSVQAKADWRNPINRHEPPPGRLSKKKSSSSLVDVLLLGLIL